MTEIDFTSIDVERTIDILGYDPRQLGPFSKKRVFVICSQCGNGRKREFREVCKRPDNVCLKCIKDEARKKREFIEEKRAERVKATEERAIRNKTSFVIACPTCSKERQVSYKISLKPTDCTRCAGFKRRKNNPKANIDELVQRIEKSEKSDKYERIYISFIESRKKKQTEFLSEDYIEIHHILPRCMGGTDKLDNLIKLTPEDHFFAHLLLAKAYGGKNWLALSSMLNRGMKTEKIEYKNFKNKRKTFGLVRRLLAKNLTGLNNHQSDTKIYTLRHIDGREIVGYRFEISKKLGCEAAQIGRLLKPNTRHKSYKGWYYPENNPNGIIGADGEKIRKKLIDKTIHHLFHPSGKQWSGTKWEFKEQFFSPLQFTKEHSHCCGWFKTKEAAKTAGLPRSGSYFRKVYDLFLAGENITFPKHDVSRKEYDKNMEAISVMKNRYKFNIEYVEENDNLIARITP